MLATSQLTFPPSITVLGLAHTHPLICNKDIQIKSVKFADSIANCKTSGKKKRGALFVHAGQAIGTVSYVDVGEEKEMVIKSPIKSKMVACNTKVCESPELLTNENYTSGYLLVLLSKPKEYKDSCSVKREP
jgi:hypothetical protein